MGRILLLFSCVAIVPPAVSAQELAPDDIVAKAREARGREDALAKVEGYQLQLRAVMFLEDQKINFRGSVTVRGLDFSRFELRNDDFGKITTVRAGKEGWIRKEGMTRKMTDAEVLFEQENAYLSWVNMTLPITAPGFELQRLPTEKKDKRTLLAVRVKHKDRPDMEFWFDSETFLPARLRYRTKRPDGKEAEMDAWVSNPKSFDGVTIPTKSTVYRNGKLWMHTEVMEAKFFTDGRELDFSKP